MVHNQTRAAIPMRGNFGTYITLRALGNISDVIGLNRYRRRNSPMMSCLRGFPDGKRPKTARHVASARRRVMSPAKPTSTHAFELSIDRVYSLESSRPLLIHAKDLSTLQRSGIGVNPGRSVMRVLTSTRTPVARLASSTMGPA
jgi:hypothetical protein